MSDSIIVENKRILLRIWRLDDAPAAYQFYSDPEVSRYIGDGQPLMDMAKVERKLSLFIQHQQEKGFSPWAVLEKQSNEIVGVCGLHRYNEEGEVELGFRMNRKSWGKGFATEAAKLSIEYGFVNLQLSRIAATARIENTASRRVLEKVGFTFVGEKKLVEDEHPYYYYETFRR
ncbi:MAG: GNAT family N-acetyltransferase [Oligoflexales bacterium]